MHDLLIRAKTIFSLGVLNIWRLAIYRVKIKLNLVGEEKKEITKGIFFNEISEACIKNSERKSTLESAVCYFGWFQVKVEQYPNWHCNPFNGVETSNQFTPWWKISDFGNKLGDIKNCLGSVTL